MAGGALFVLAALASLGGAAVLYLLVRSEHDRRETMGRAEAERTARRDTPDRE